MRRLQLLGFFLAVSLTPAPALAQVGHAEQESKERFSIRQWEQRGYEDGKQGRGIGLASTGLGACLMGAVGGGCCGCVGGFAGGSAGCLSGLLLEELLAPHPSRVELSPKEWEAYMRGFNRGRSDTRIQTGAVGAVITAVSMGLGLLIGLAVVAGG